MPKLTRQQVEEHLRRGEHVAVGARTLKPGPRAETRAALDAAFPQPGPAPEVDAEGRPVRGESQEDAARVEAVVTHDAGGRLTRAGMEHAIRQGGGVLLQPAGEIVTRLEDLPDEVELARDDAARLEAHLGELDERHGRLVRERDRARGALEAARQKQAEAPPTEGQAAAAPKPPQGAPPDMPPVPPDEPDEPEGPGGPPAPEGEPPAAPPAPEQEKPRAGRARDRGGRTV
jgi:hypothetical protein